jgi:hypothetical protein
MAFIDMHAFGKQMNQSSNNAVNAHEKNSQNNVF